MATGNENFRDAVIRHQIHLMRLVGQIRNEVFATLNATEPAVRALIEQRLDTLHNAAGVDITKPGAARRVAALEKAITDLRGKAFDDVFSLWNTQLRDMAVAEAEFLKGAIQTTMPVVLDPRLPEQARLRALIREDPFRGRTMRDWARNLRSADLDRIRNEIRIGLIDGDSNRNIARRVVGTASLRGGDGVTEITRRQAASITRTAVTHFSNAAKQEFYTANDDIIEQEVYTATLDARTTDICASLDGRRFPVGEGPYPPQHWNCRSVRIAVVTADLIGDRPMKTATERELVDEFSRGRGFTGTRRADIPRGMKGEFDRFARRRTRELTGRVPATQSYGEFLRNQSRAFQEEVLGVTKARLFRQGRLPLDRFVNRRGDSLTLAQMAARDREAFLRAGLDPNEFLRAA